MAFVAIPILNFFDKILNKLKIFILNLIFLFNNFLVISFFFSETFLLKDLGKFFCLFRISNFFL